AVCGFWIVPAIARVKTVDHTCGTGPEKGTAGRDGTAAGQDDWHRNQLDAPRNLGNGLAVRVARNINNMFVIAVTVTVRGDKVIEVKIYLTNQTVPTATRASKPEARANSRWRIVHAGPA